MTIEQFKNEAKKSETITVTVNTKKYDFEIEADFCRCSVTLVALHKNTWNEDIELREVYQNLYGNFLNPETVESKFFEVLEQIENLD